MEQLLNALLRGDQTQINKEFQSTMIQKIGMRMEEKKREVASKMFQNESVYDSDSTDTLLFNLNNYAPVYRDAVKAKTKEALKTVVMSHLSKLPDIKKINIKKINWQQLFDEFRDELDESVYDSDSTDTLLFNLNNYAPVYRDAVKAKTKEALKTVVMSHLSKLPDIKKINIKKINWQQLFDEFRDELDD